jgi:hypothetical protein
LEKLLAVCEIRPAVNQVQSTAIVLADSDWMPPALTSKRALGILQPQRNSDRSLFAAWERWFPSSRESHSQSYRRQISCFRQSSLDFLAKSAIRWFLSWHVVARGAIVLPKSVTPHRIKENFSVVELSKEDISALEEFAEKNGGPRRLIDPPWGRDLGFADGLGARKVSDGRKWSNSRFRVDIARYYA